MLGFSTYLCMYRGRRGDTLDNQGWAVQFLFLLLLLRRLVFNDTMDRKMIAGAMDRINSLVSIDVYLHGASEPPVSS